MEYKLKNKFSWLPTKTLHGWIWLKKYQIKYIFDISYVDKCLMGIPTHVCDTDEFVNDEIRFTRYVKKQMCVNTPSKQLIKNYKNYLKSIMRLIEYSHIINNIEHKYPPEYRI